MRWKPLGSTWIRNRRMNSCDVERHRLVAAGAVDPVVLDLERHRLPSAAIRRRFEMATRWV